MEVQPCSPFDLAAYLIFPALPRKCSNYLLSGRCAGVACTVSALAAKCTLGDLSVPGPAEYHANAVQPPDDIRRSLAQTSDRIFTFQKHTGLYRIFNMDVHTVILSGIIKNSVYAACSHHRLRPLRDIRRHQHDTAVQLGRSYSGCQSCNAASNNKYLHISTSARPPAILQEIQQAIPEPRQDPRHIR